MSVQTNLGALRALVKELEDMGWPESITFFVNSCYDGEMKEHARAIVARGTDAYDSADIGSRHKLYGRRSIDAQEVE